MSGIASLGEAIVKLILANAIAALTIAAAVTAATPVSAAYGAWCAVYSDSEGAQNCYFATRAACEADLRGRGGFCMPNGMR